MSTKIGHFEILSELSKSATCVVYKANDAETSQTVALKAIQLSAFGEHAAELPDGDERLRFGGPYTERLFSNLAKFVSQQSR